MFKSSRDEGSESVRLMYLLSIASAEKTIRLQAAYFCAGRFGDRDARLGAQTRREGRDHRAWARRPIRKSCRERAAHAGRALLDAGALIYEFQPALYHCKVILVDDVWVSVGSTNFDNRSFRLNDEANLNIYDGVFAKEQACRVRGPTKRVSRA